MNRCDPNPDDDADFRVGGLCGSGMEFSPKKVQCAACGLRFESGKAFKAHYPGCPRRPPGPWAKGSFQFDK